MKMANGPTNEPVVNAAQAEERADSLPRSQPEILRQIGFAGAGFSTVPDVAPNRLQNVAPATKKRGPGHISDHAPEPAKPVSPAPDWDAVRVPDRGEEKSYFSGPIYWKFRTDRGCWRVQFKATPAAPALDLGNIGKRELTALDALSDVERTAAILGKVRGWLAEQGIRPAA
ncbi:MAG: hypothetical protein ACKVX9_24455 [Blastocatellia bacterium]